MGKRLYITRDEVQRLMSVTAMGRYAERDSCMILFGYLHGLRVSELTGLKLCDLDIEGRRIFIRRLKNGLSTVHPLQPEEMFLFNKWMEIRHQIAKNDCEWLFVTNRGGRMSRQRVSVLLKRYGNIAGLGITVHPHMLRHGCGYELAEQGLDTRLIQDYLGHKNIQHTVHYTAGNAARFTVAWKK
ncbi:tyrosine-type recombinase/integrase [Enterobacter hormaechei]|uniref:tyrosine-type recombinase/integrase n=1 Tax=Enterobacter hormaechei TaxID=158836 RepID=UPI0032DB16B9